MTIREKVNGARGPISIGTITGLLVAAIGFIGLNLTLTDRYRGQGASAAEVEKRVEATERWIADYEKNVRPLRDEFLRLTGELKGLPNQITELKTEMRRLNDRLDRIEMRRRAMP